ncbi:MAG: sulfatase-like hydrolase/transferase [Aureliella sp.]
MNRSVHSLRSNLTTVLLAVATTLNATWVSTLQADDRPNIIVILCDDLGYGDLECYGHPHIKTPNLNALAESGIRLTNCYSAAPVCSPSRVGLLTGRSPNRAGVYDWIPASNGQPRPDGREQVHMRSEEVTIAHLLRDAGYATCMSGKWHCNAQFNSSAQPQPGDAGFDHWFGTQNNASPSHENPNNYVRNGNKVGELTGFSCQLASDEALNWIEKHNSENSDQPFFVYLAFHEPHEPVASPSTLVDIYREAASEEDEAQYFANVANVDAAVGKVVKKLEDLKLRDNTLIIFTSDNGPETLKRYSRANRSWGRPTPLRGMKLWTTDAGFRVAGIMSWPRQIDPGQTGDEVVSSLDFLPTFCHLAKRDVPDQRELDGTDLRPLFSGRQVERAKPLVWCYYNSINEHRAAMRFGEWKMLAKLDGGKYKKHSNVNSKNSDQVAALKLTDFELYRISADISESEDLFGEVAESDELRQVFEEQYSNLLDDYHVWEIKTN